MERVGRLSAIWLAVLVAAALLAGCDEKQPEQQEQQDAGGMAIEEKVDEVRREVDEFGRQVDEAIEEHTAAPDAGP